MTADEKEQEHKTGNGDNIAERESTLWLEITRPFIGYWVVTWGCAIAGSLLSFDLVGSSFDLVPIGREIVAAAKRVLLFELLILPLYYMYGTIYSRTRAGDVRALKSDYAIYAILALVIVLTLLASVVAFSDSTNVRKSSLRLDWKHLVRVLISVFPFHLWANWIWVMARKRNSTILWFRYRTFFPALITCGLSFTYGWSTSSETDLLAWLVPLCGMAVVAGLWLASQIDRQQPKLLYRIGIFVFWLLFIPALCLGVLSPNGELKPLFVTAGVLFFALILTMFIGVFEASCVMTRVIHDKQLVFSGCGASNSNEIKRTYIAGVNGAIAYLFPLFLTTVLHPSVNYIYVFGVFILVVGYYWIWVCSDGGMPSKFSFCVLGRVFGFLALLLLVIGAGFRTETTFRLPEFLDRIPFADLVAPFALLIVSVKLLRQYETDYCLLGHMLLGKFKSLPYEQKSSSVALTVIVAGVLSVTMFIIWFTIQALVNLETNKEVSRFAGRTVMLLLMYVVYQGVGWLGERRLVAMREACQV